MQRTDGRLGLRDKEHPGFADATFSTVTGAGAERAKARPAIQERHQTTHIDVYHIGRHGTYRRIRRMESR